MSVHSCTHIGDKIKFWRGAGACILYITEWSGEIDLVQGRAYYTEWSGEIDLVQGRAYYTEWSGEIDSQLFVHFLNDD